MDQHIREPERREMVNHPQHYGGDTTYEVVKVLDAWGLDQSFYLGNVIKYVARSRKKGSLIQDLEKAAWYLNREIENLKKRFEVSNPRSTVKSSAFAQPFGKHGKPGSKRRLR